MQGTKFLAGAWGKAPNVPQREAKQRENSQGAKQNLTDGWRIKAAFNRREAEMGFGDEIPKRGMGVATPW